MSDESELRAAFRGMRGVSLPPDEMRQRVMDARVARLATVSGDGQPHVVPACFAVADNVIYTAVDAKPKKSTRLRRTANVEATGVAALLVDWYDEDWSQLWWVRVDASARVVRDDAERTHALTALERKYSQYAEMPPEGDVIALDIRHWSSWTASQSSDSTR